MDTAKNVDFRTYFSMLRHPRGTRYCVYSGETLVAANVTHAQASKALRDIPDGVAHAKACLPVGDVIWL